MEEEFPNFVWPEGVELQQYLPFTVLKQLNRRDYKNLSVWVATVLTVYGIETRKRNRSDKKKKSLKKLQQYLPFTVLKLTIRMLCAEIHWVLQQYLPFTVLKLEYLPNGSYDLRVATVLTVYGIETRL